MDDDFDLPPEAPGHYVPLRADQPVARAYFPNNLPPNLELTEDVVELLAEATWALGRLDGLGSEVDDPGGVFSSFVYKEAEQSSQVEGTAVTVADIYRYEMGELSGTDDRSEAVHEADVREARNYVRALDEAVSFLQTAGRSRESITLELVKELHERLLEDGRTGEEDPLPGEFRPGLAVIEEAADHGVGTQIRFVPPPAHNVPGLMEDLERFVQSGRWPTLVDVAVVHYQFETIHPFEDGNGRVGRLLIVLLLLCSDLLHYPLLSPSSHFERYRGEYTDHLLAVSEQGEWEPWIRFFLEGIREQAEEAFVRAKLLLEKRHEYETRYAQAPESVRRLALALFEEPYVSVPEAEEIIGMTYQTANTAVDELVGDGVLEEITGQEWDRVFRASEVVDVLERPATQLPDPNDLVDVETAWRLPDQ